MVHSKNQWIELRKKIKNSANLRGNGENEEEECWSIACFWHGSKIFLGLLMCLTEEGERMVLDFPWVHTNKEEERE